MLGIVLTNKGIEEFCAQEVGELGAKNVQAGERLVSFECKGREELCAIAYRAQSAERVLEVLVDESGPDVLELIRSAGPKLAGVTGMACVEASRFGTHAFDSVVVKQETARLLKSVDYEDFERLVYVVVVDQRVVIGIDVAGVDLSKREYKVFTNSFSLKATVGYALVRMTGWSSGMLLDPLCRDGVVAIEAAHFAHDLSPRRFEKRRFAAQSPAPDRFGEPLDFEGGVLATDGLFANISAAKKNAKIALVHKLIDFRKYAVDDIDLQVEKESVSVIATSCTKVPAKFFERTHFVLAAKGRIALLVQESKGVKESAVAAGFEVMRETQFWMGKNPYPVFLFGKNGKK